MIIIKGVINTEKVMRIFEQENKMLFEIGEKATKHDVKQTLEEKYNIIVEKVNTFKNFKGKKLAWVKLSPKHPVSELATKFRLI